jgi:phage terminase Nu1 subunit (DNA packaging protein)
MVLSKCELAEAFEVSLNTISNWTLQGLPCHRPGRPGTACQYRWADCAFWLLNEKYWRFSDWNYEDPETIVERAYERAKQIVERRLKDSKG